MLAAFSLFLKSGLLFHEFIHGVFFIPIGLYLWQKYHSQRVVWVGLLVTYLIDLDHLVDYLSFIGLHLDVNTIAFSYYFKDSGFIFTPLHGWEYVLLLTALYYYSKNRKAKPYYLAIALGLLGHYIWDSIWISSVIHYSILWRAIHGFKVTV